MWTRILEGAGTAAASDQDKGVYVAVHANDNGVDDALTEGAASTGMEMSGTQNPRCQIW